MMVSVTSCYMFMNSLTALYSTVTFGEVIALLASPRLDFNKKTSRKLYEFDLKCITLYKHDFSFLLL